MSQPVKRREFLQLTLAGTAVGFGCTRLFAWDAGPKPSPLLSPGCRRSKVKVARLYLAIPGGTLAQSQAGYGGGSRHLPSGIRGAAARTG